MKISIKIAIALISISVVIGTLGYISIIPVSKLADPLENDIPESIDKLATQSHLDGLAQFIRYYDEVLTQSARNYAFTQDKKWESRYTTTEPELDKIIQQAITKGDDVEKNFFSKVNDANIVLVEMEYNAINLVNEGNPDEAIEILESHEYWEQKRIYEQALRDYVTKRGSEYDKALVASTETLDEVTTNIQLQIKEIIEMNLIFLPFIMALGVGVSYAVLRSITKPINELKAASEKIASGDLNTVAKINGNDEIADLAKSFNSMILSIKTSQDLHVAAEKKYRDLYDGSPDLYRSINLDGIIIDCNKSYVKHLDYTKDEVIGKSIFEFVPDESKDALCKSFETWKKTGKVSNQEMLLKKKDGSVFPALLSASNLYDEAGNLVGSNTIIRDISELRSAQREIEELKTKRLSAIGELTGRIVHDIRNPLSIIKNSVGLLKLKENINDETIPIWERMDRAISRMTHQIEDVLDYIRMAPLKKNTNSLSMILKHAVERLEIPDNVEIRLPKNDVTIPCDSEKIEAVFVNLIMNSFQAINDKQGTITIETSEKPGDEDFVLIEFNDTGPGIPKDVLVKIFDPLFTTKQIGTGLGLPSCKNIIEQHDGTIDVKSTVEMGTTFLIRLPKKTTLDDVSKKEKNTVQSKMI